MDAAVNDIVDPEAQNDRQSILAALHCPFCGSDLEPILSRAAPRPGAEYGVLRCACARYPVVEGIPVLQHVEGLDRVVGFIQAGDVTRALLHAMNVFRVKWAHKSRWHQARYYLNCRRLASDPRLTLQDALDMVRQPQGFADYLFHRYANPSFMSDMALMPIAGAFFRDRPLQAGTRSSGPARVLDLACGAGHSSFLMTHWFPEISVIAADQDFVSLYVAKRFLAPAATYVCFDSEAPNPFPNGCFDAVHCLDAFHYFKSKRAIVADLRRAVRPGGLWVFPHLHNALADNVTAGIPLPPESYRRCFEALDPQLFDESDVRKSVAAPGDSLRPKADGELSGAQCLAVVCGASVALRERKPMADWALRSARNLGVNPVYAGAWSGDVLKLQIEWPNEVLRRECIDAEAVLPRTLEISRRDLASILTGEGSVSGSVVRDLVNEYVLVPQPPRYGRRDLAAVVRS